MNDLQGRCILTYAFADSSGMNESLQLIK